MGKKQAVVLIGILVSVLLLSFADSGYFSIAEADVELHLPKAFPKPLYRFKNNKLTPQKFVLGRMLFNDPILSKDSSTSCASCHQRIAAFGHIDHTLSHGIYGLIGKRNVPALQNLIWKDAYMWDGSITHLEQQSLGPISNPIEMDESIDNIVMKLKRNKEYVRLFHEAYGDADISKDMVLKSLTQFVGLMISADSRYDRFINGKDTFSAQETRGLALFRANCGTCHKEPLFTDNTYRNNGLAEDTTLKDKGRGGISGSTEDEHKFKVPSLRNVEMTYPYMHDGRYKRLRDILNHYSGTAKTVSGVDEDVKKIPALSDKDKTDIVAFLLTLTDKTFLHDRRFIDPFVKL